eukprot:10820142-Alexandrium_andersonii.AAC.1
MWLRRLVGGKQGSARFLTAVKNEPQKKWTSGRPSLFPLAAWLGSLAWAVRWSFRCLLEEPAGS